MGRLQLQSRLEVLLGTPYVYFQPPPSLVINYPCIVYHIDKGDTDFAGNRPYRYYERYQVTVIDEDPDTDIRFKIAALPTSIFDRWYAANNLNHYVYNLYC
jgi:hypothetical protein